MGTIGAVGKCFYPLLVVVSIDIGYCSQFMLRVLVCCWLFWLCILDEVTVQMLDITGHQLMSQSVDATPFCPIFGGVNPY